MIMNILYRVNLLSRNLPKQIEKTYSTILPNVTEPDKLYKLVEFELKGNDPAVLKSYQKFATIAARHLDIESKTWSLKKPIHERYTLLKSVHIYKKHRVQYEYRTYFSFIRLKYLTGSTADTIIEYYQRNLPEGVAMKTTKVELLPKPEHLKPDVKEKV